MNADRRTLLKLTAGLLLSPLASGITGAVVALSARLAIRRLHRASRHHDPLIGFGGYPMSTLRDPQFMTRRQRTA